MKILALGEVVMRLMPADYKKLSQTNHLEYLFSGTGINVMSGLYQMGDTTYLTTVLPDNNVGYAAASHIRKLGIMDTHIFYQGNHMGIYILEKGIGNRPSEVTYLNRHESAFHKSRIEDYDFSMLDGMDAVHVCGISLAANTDIQEVIYAFMLKAKEKGIKTIFDCNFRPSLWKDNTSGQIKEIYQKILSLADIVFAGEKDATLLLDIKPNDVGSKEEQLQDVLQQMCQIYDIEMLFGTKRGLLNNQPSLQGYYASKTDFSITKKYHVTVYDRIGGGDGFAAGAIHAYLHGFDMQKVITYATFSGLLAHTTYGDSPVVTKQEILDCMENEYQDVKR